jgi:hypothetical protein
MTPLGRMIDPLLQCTLEMRETLCRRAEFHILADVVAALFTTVTGIAGNADFQSYSVAGGEVGYGRTDSGDDAGGFMTESQGFADENVAVAVVVVVVEVAAAEAGAVDCYLDLVCRGSGEVAGFLFEVSILSMFLLCVGLDQVFGC